MTTPAEAALEAMARALAQDDPEPFLMHGEIVMSYYRKRAAPVLTAFVKSEAVWKELREAAQDANHGWCGSRSADAIRAALMPEPNNKEDE